MVVRSKAKTSVFDVGMRVLKGMALPMALFITALCSLISLHIFSMALEQDKSIQRSFVALKENIESENTQEKFERMSIVVEQGR